MLNTFRLCSVLFLALGLAACNTAPNSNRTTHSYAFGRPAAHTAAGVAPVVVSSQPSQKGPANVAHIVYFDFDSYTVRPEDRGIIDSHARWLQSNPGRSLTLQGNTDARGGTEYNLALGQKRAEAVRKNLEILGVNANRVEAVSYGKERLVEQGSSEAAHQRNRRVEFEYR
ncbi:OmpA family protein [Comamonas sp. Y6]|uniref:Peptidoglycan-associated lipoprotein n=1 Tax=Comamonas resistens TaxID=3046670 RepID=A0ABY8SRA7_9BURK|nr:OmpA family protein [Comamonas resistens]MDL5035891.1 OmpA family protein [Comamonas resistens]WHS65295.1 OmpA family protein [Comamonas resistens]